MRPTTVVVTGIEVSAPIPIDLYLSPLNLGLAVTLSATATYTVQYTLDNVWSPTFNPATATWVSVTGLTALSANASVAFSTAARALRLNVAASTGDVTMVLTQVGLGVIGAPGTTGGGGAGTVSVTGPLTGDGSPGSPLALDTSAAFTFTGLQTISLAEPRLRFNETDAGADLKLWDIDVNAGVFSIRTRTDADGAGINVLVATRGATTAISNITIGGTGNPTYTFPGSGTMTVPQLTSTVNWTTSGAFTVGRVILTSATISSCGIYTPAANQLGFSTSSTLRGLFDANGQFIISTVGRGLSVPEGANAKMGVATLVGGTVVVSTTAVTATSRIQLNTQSLGTVIIPSALGVSARTAGTSFTILASQATDTSVVSWLLIEPS